MQLSFWFSKVVSFNLGVLFQLMIRPTNINYCHSHNNEWYWAQFNLFVSGGNEKLWRIWIFYSEWSHKLFWFSTLLVGGLSTVRESSKLWEQFVTTIWMWKFYVDLTGSNQPAPNLWTMAFNISSSWQRAKGQFQRRSLVITVS